MKKEKIIYIVLALIAVVAIIVTAINGLNLSLKYSQSKQVQVEIGKEFDSNDIIRIGIFFVKVVVCYHSVSSLIVFF